MNDSNGNPLPEKEVADHENVFFTSIGPNLAKTFNDRWTYDGVETKKVISDMVVQEEEDLKLFKEISTVKSSAIPNISARIFKDAFCAISPVMTKLYKLSLSQGIFPSSWKIATIIPLPKEGDLKDVNNYRPVSLLPLPGQILEKLVHSRVMKHLEELHLLCDNEAGIKNHSTIDSVAKVTDDIFEGINQKQMIIAAFIDFKKAFDTMTIQYS